MRILAKKDQNAMDKRDQPIASNCPENTFINSKCLAIHNGLKYKIANPVLLNVAFNPLR